MWECKETKALNPGPKKSWQDRKLSESVTELGASTEPQSSENLFGIVFYS